ncbi:MAG: TIGR01777 family oxidoreductase [Actinobacteria bacterium]|nr:TIGR01777 family oxidoreductase [Actinomycetota bacterium]
MANRGVVVIAGASGLIGKAFSTALRSHGQRVVALVRSRATSADELQWDPSRAQLDERALEALGEIEAIVNLSGAGIADRRWSTKRKHEILDSRVNATRGLLEASAKLNQPPKSFLSASAIGFYGNRGDVELDEESLAGEGFLADVCKAWEAEAEAADRIGMRRITLRTGIVLTPLGGALAKQLPLFRAGLGGRLASGKQWMSWISLEDQIAAMGFLLDQEETKGVFNLTAPQALTNAVFTSTLARHLHRPAIAVAPRLALAAALGVELVDEMLLTSQRVLPRALLNAGFAFASPTLDEALTAMFSRPKA